MIYDFNIKTPANTLVTNKLKTTLKITSGVIHQVDIVFPAGCAGLLHVAINRGLNQVWPSNPQGNFASSGESISFKEFYEYKEEPLEFFLHTWNDDDTYDHTIILRLGILQKTEIQGIWLPWSEEVI